LNSSREARIVLKDLAGAVCGTTPVLIALEDHNGALCDLGRSLSQRSIGATPVPRDHHCVTETVIQAEERSVEQVRYGNPHWTEPVRVPPLHPGCALAWLVADREAAPLVLQHRGLVEMFLGERARPEGRHELRLVEQVSEDALEPARRHRRED